MSINDHKEEKLIEKGTFGTIYSGIETKKGKKVAIKYMHKKFL